MVHVLVIGAYGSAGSAVAESLAGRDGVELTLVDDGDPGGGLCILRGCMPSKAILSAAEHAHAPRHDPRVRGEAEVDLEAVVERKDERVLGYAEHRRAAIHELADCEGVSFHHETARFVDDRVVAVGDERYEPDYVVVATGSTVTLPDLPGMDADRVLTSADVLDATELPDSGVVMGFGYVGLELVPYLAAAGVDLTVIEHDDVPIDEAGPAFGETILERYAEDFGVEIRTTTHERRVEWTDEGVRLHVEDEDGTDAIDAEALFCFTGRRPAVDGLGLEAAGVDVDPGWVEPTMQTRDHPRVFAVGDVNGHEPILHVAKEQGALAAENLLAHHREEPLEPYENVHHHVIFTGLGIYPFARVGHSPERARDAGLDPIVVERAAADDGVFGVKELPYGLARLVVDRDGTVLGYVGLHYHADVMAKTMQVIVELGLDVRDVPDRAYHPTTPEILDGLFREATAALEARGSGAEQ